jgi:hypothetical protein
MSPPPVSASVAALTAPTKETGMGRIVISENVPLDGVVQTVRLLGNRTVGYGLACLTYELVRDA